MGRFFEIWEALLIIIGGAALAFLLILQAFIYSVPLGIILLVLGLTGASAWLARND